MCRTPQGVRGLKLRYLANHVKHVESHSARSAWIETNSNAGLQYGLSCRTPQGVRGLKQLIRFHPDFCEPSHSARSAWIETTGEPVEDPQPVVALRKECVD